MRQVSLTNQLAEVRSLLRAMSDRVFTAMGVIRRHLETPDKDELMKVVLLDNEVDRLEKTIDEKILYIFATQQPLGQELREAYASVKIAHQIERIGDAVESLARQLSGGNAQSLDRSRLINRMLEASMQLFQTSYRAMFEGDFAPVIDIYVKDDEVDRLHKSLTAEAKGRLQAQASGPEVESAIQLINIGNKLEKIADISCNWAEQIDFLLHGMHRRRITRRPQRIVLTDCHGGMLAALVAGYLSKAPGIQDPPDDETRGYEFTLATRSPEAGVVSFGGLAAEVLSKRRWPAEFLPVTNLKGVQWERVLVALFLGPDFTPTDPADGKFRHKVVDLFWPDLHLSPELLAALLGDRHQTSTAPLQAAGMDGTKYNDTIVMQQELNGLLDQIEGRAAALVSILRRMRKPR